MEVNDDKHLSINVNHSPGQPCPGENRNILIPPRNNSKYNIEEKLIDVLEYYDHFNRVPFTENLKKYCPI